MRFYGCIGCTPNELIHASYFGNFASVASSDIECKNAGYDIAVIETSQLAVIPLGFR